VSRNSGPSANRYIANPNTACASVGTDAVPYIELMCFRFFLSSAAARRNDDGRTPMRRQRLYSTSIDVNQPHNSTAGGFDLPGSVGDIFIRSANCLKLATAVLRTIMRIRSRYLMQHSVPTSQWNLTPVPAFIKSAHLNRSVHPWLIPWRLRFFSSRLDC